MRKTTAIITALLLCLVVPAFAVYKVIDAGAWPKTWPKQLEPLRKQSRTLVGPEAEDRHYAIPFTNRKDFEAAWPQILKVRSKGSPIILEHSPNFFLGDKVTAGVVVHCPPLTQPDTPSTLAAPNTGAASKPEDSRNATRIELLVDNDIVNVKRITMPKDAKVTDNRSK